MATLFSFLFILLLVMLNAFFVSVEFAAVASRKSRLEQISEPASDAAQIVRSWLDNPAARDRLIAASQLGITIVSLALGAVGEAAFEALLAPYFEVIEIPETWGMAASVARPLISGLPLAISLVTVTSIHVVLGEQVPKVAALHTPERFALLAAPAMNLFTRVFKWFIDILDWTTRQILGLVGLQMKGEHLSVYTLDEIKEILDESEEVGVIASPAREMLESIFDLNELVVRQVMLPRTEIQAVEVNTPVAELLALVTNARYTKYPVYEDSLDQIVGILHVKDLLRCVYDANNAPLNLQGLSVRKLMREALYIPEAVSVNVLLRHFRDNRQHIAVVLDEYGGTAGMVTLEDLLEEIVGEVGDVFDKDGPEIQTLPDGSILIAGMTQIEEVNAHLGLELEDPDYDTIAGFVLGRLKRLAHAGDVVEHSGVRIRVETMDGLRIAQLSMTILPPPESQQDETSTAQKQTPPPAKES